MAASGKTSNYSIPIYQPNDTANYLTSYNGGMNIIDTQLRANADVAAAAESKAVMVEGKADANSLAIQELGNKVDGIELPEVLAITPNSNVQYINGQFLTALGINFCVAHTYIGKVATDVPVKVETGGQTLIPLFSVPGNIFKLQEGAEHNIIVGNSEISTNTPSSEAQAGNLTCIAWLIGGVTYIGMNFTSLLQYTVYDVDIEIIYYA